MNQDKILAALGRLAEDKQPVRLECSKFELWCALSAMQLAFRHPSYRGPSRTHAERFHDEVGRVLCSNDPDLRLLFEMGRDRRFDHVRAPGEEMG